MGHKLLSNLIYTCLPRLIRLVFVKKIYGYKNIPKSGPVLIAANHASHLDPIIVPALSYLFTGRKVHYMAKKELFKVFFVGTFLKIIDTIVVDREKGGKEALREAITMLENGNIIGVFPEGTRTSSNKLGKPKTGIARLALWSNATIIPCALDNTIKIFPKKKIFPRIWRRTNIYFGTPVSLKTYNSENKEDWKKLTDDVMKEITTLLLNSEYGKKNYKI